VEKIQTSTKCVKNNFTDYWKNRETEEKLKNNWKTENMYNSVTV
jgi:hypothetical protein